MISETDLAPVYYVEYDENGRIIQQGTESALIFGLAVEQGARRIITEKRDILNMEEVDYVDFSGSEPVVKSRPVLNQTFDKSEVPAGQEAVIPAIPKCTVYFKGVVNGTQEHGGGDLSIGFGIPGEYEISFTAFPYMPATFKLTVTKGS